MIRVALYARYSSDNQRDASIEDQLRICQERAIKEGWTIVQVYSDHAISGASMHRAGVKALLRDAIGGKFDIILSEALDRLSRDQEDVAGFYKRTQFAGVKIFTLAEGEISSLHIGLKGTMNALFLKDMADKVRRGQRGRVEQGKAGGGIGYGYSVVRRFDANGEPERGERAINDAQAAIVRRIFKEYARGKSPKAIAQRLNVEGIEGPSGAGWTASTINGNWQRGSGILNNDLYQGVIAWNKVRYIKNPDTGKHVTRNNPPEEWIRKDVPELRIVDQVVWDLVKLRQNGLRRTQKKFWEKQRPKNLFSFMLRCGCCGGGVSKISTLMYGCSTSRNKGEAICTNRRNIRQDELERTVLSALTRHLMEPELVKAFCDEYTAHINRLRIEHNSSLVGYQAELNKIDRQERRIIEAVKEGYANEMMKTEFNACGVRRKELEALLAGKEPAPVLLHPNMAQRYRTEVAALVGALNDEERREEAAELIRSLVDKIVLTPDPNSKGLLVDLHGDLAGILNVATKPGRAKPTQELDLKQIRMVVGMDFAIATEARDKVVGPEPRRFDHNKVVGSGATHLGDVQRKVVGPAGLEPATRPL